MKKHASIFSFFSGAGFLDLGFEDCGYEVCFVNEIHEPFLNAYKHSRKAMSIPEPAFGYSSLDIAAYSHGSNAEFLRRSIQIQSKKGLVGFIGGPPCPDFSVGGKNKGKHGDNGKLSGTYINLIAKFKPDFFLFENVKGLWRTQKHREFFEELKCKLRLSGYCLTEKLINSVEYGAPQDRDRIILIGFSKAVLKALGKDARKDSDVDGKFPWKDALKYTREQVFGLPWPQTDNFRQDSALRAPNGIIPELTVQHWFERNKVEKHPNFKHCFQPKAGLTRFKQILEGDDSRKSYKRLHRWRYSPTACYGNNEVHLHPYKARRINAAEALAIQSVPPKFVLPDNMTLTDMFKTIGNGVPFLAAKGLASSIKKFLEK